MFQVCEDVPIVESVEVEEQLPYRTSDDHQQTHHAGHEEDEEGPIISRSNTIVEIATMMINTVYTAIAEATMGRSRRTIGFAGGAPFRLDPADFLAGEKVRIEFIISR